MEKESSQERTKAIQQHLREENENVRKEVGDEEIKLSFHRLLTIQRASYEASGRK